MTLVRVPVKGWIVWMRTCSFGVCQLMSPHHSQSAAPCNVSLTGISMNLRSQVVSSKLGLVFLKN